MTDVLARVLAALDAGDGFALSVLNDATLAAAWAACDRPSVLCLVEEHVHGGPSATYAHGSWIQDAGRRIRRGARCACMRHYLRCDEPPCVPCADAVRAAIGRPPTAAEVRDATRRPR